MITFDANDSHSVALCAWKEARGDGQDGMRAVMHIIANRTGHPEFPLDVHGVVYGKNQFTSMSVPSDPEFNLEPKNGDPEFQYCMGIVSTVLDGQDQDLTHGAHYYDNPKSATSGWFYRVIVRNPRLHPLLARIGRQDFYR